MKKLIYLSLIVILIVLGFCLFKICLSDHEERSFSADEERLEKVIFQKDSENRGYSDVVKQKIEQEFGNNNALSDSFKKKAKSYRQLLRSKTSKEFMENHKKSLMQENCIVFLLKKKSDFAKKLLIAKDIVFDNKAMFGYYNYLRLVRFGQEENIRELTRWKNSFESAVENELEYSQKCDL